MADPVIASRTPIPVEVEAGKTYYWCTCGKSTKQPFCDGTHKGSEFAPQAYTPEVSGKAYFCGCKHSTKAPLCDGSHRQLPKLTLPLAQCFQQGQRYVGCAAATAKAGEKCRGEFALRHPCAAVPIMRVAVVEVHLA